MHLDVNLLYLIVICHWPLIFNKGQMILCPVESYDICEGW